MTHSAARLYNPRQWEHLQIEINKYYHKLCQFIKTLELMFMKHYDSNYLLIHKDDTFFF